MKEKQTLLWKNKRIFLKLVNGRIYTGLVLDETDKNIILRDIKNSLVSVSKTQISFIQEEVR